MGLGMPSRHRCPRAPPGLSHLKQESQPLSHVGLSWITLPPCGFRYPPALPPSLGLYLIPLRSCVFYLWSSLVFKFFLGTERALLGHPQIPQGQLGDGWKEAESWAVDMSLGHV